MFLYRSADPKTFLISEDGNENTYEMNIPWDHKLNIITMSRNHADSETWEIRYIPAKADPAYYDILASESAHTKRSLIFEAGDAYENLGGAQLQFVITGTNNKSWFPRVNLKLLALPQ